MNELILSERLKTVASEIPIGAKLADIGSDHAYLPCYAMLQGLITYAVAGEINKGPYLTAKKQVEKLQASECIKVRMGDGLEVINDGEVNVITIAGMGGRLICDILNDGKSKLAQIMRLILQPNTGAHFVREWLLANDWILCKEYIIEEDGKIYEILVAEQGDSSLPYIGMKNRKAALLLGPHLLKEQSPVFLKKWDAEITKWKKILKQLEEATETEDTIEKREQLIERIKMVEEVLGR